jgi:hypothetical protein
MYRYLFILLFLVSCANYKTFNQVSSGEVTLVGGVNKNKSWPDKLTFKRMSWYHGMTLYFDTLVYKAEKTSPFSSWFSDSDMEYFKKCEKLLVTIDYSSDPSKISHVMFREQMKLNGYDDVVINSFSSSVRNHPTYQSWNLQNYKIIGYCKRAPSKFGADADELVINFPSFKQIELDFE